MSTGSPEMSALALHVREQPLWLGSDTTPIFAHLATPMTSSSRGGIIIAPAIGRETRMARVALRTLAMTLAGEGFAVLRFDHFGTGDSSGGFDDDRFFVEWTDQVTRGVEFLRSLGSSLVSAVGLRLGATILGRSANLNSLGLSSVVLWDPCESGRSYLRERAAFEAVNRDDDDGTQSGVIEKSEFVFREETKEKLRSLTLLEVEPERLGERVLIITRDDRVTPVKLSRQFDTASVEWETTSEQSAMLEGELPASKVPDVTISRIREWLCSSSSVESPLLAIEVTTAALVGANEGPLRVRERSIAVGPRELFGIVSEPVGEANGPWIVLVNGMNEDHIGPSRCWVELSRRWSSFGLRCVRFDFTSLGESPWPKDDDGPRDASGIGLEDICDVVRALSPEDPTNAVLIGLCSGAHEALQAALQLLPRGLCTINPQVGPGVLRSADRLTESDQHLIQSVTSKLRAFAEGQPWIGKLVWQMCRVFLPSAFSLKVRTTLADSGTEMLLIASPDDVIPFPRVPLLRSLDKRRLVSTKVCRVEVVPGLDHDFLSPAGRTKAIAILDAHILSKFAS
jgi:pimeloyl-ACP methyl ester carboxylesterase